METKRPKLGSEAELVRENKSDAPLGINFRVMLCIVAEGGVSGRAIAGPRFNRGKQMPYAEHYDKWGGYFFPVNKIADAEACAGQLQAYLNNYETKQTHSKEKRTNARTRKT